MLLVGFVVALQFQGFSTYIAHRITAVLSSATLRVEVDEVGGSWLRDLRVSDLRISSPPSPAGSGWAVRADTLELTYNLLSLLHRTVSLGEVRGTGVRTNVQLSSSDTAGGRGAAADTSQAGGSAWRIHVRELQLREGGLKMGGEVMKNPEADAWTLEDVGAVARDIRIGPAVRLQVDSLAGRLRARGGASWGELRLAGVYDADRILVDTLLLETPESHVAGAGIYPLGIPGPGLEGLDFRFAALPLHLADVSPFLPPGIPDSIRLRIQGDARSAGGVMDLDVDARTSAGGSLELHGEFSGRDDTSRSRVEARLADFDLASWGLAEENFPVSAEVEADADSTSGRWGGKWSLRARGIEAEGTGALRPDSPLGWEVGGTVAYRPSAGAPQIPVLDSAGAEISFEWSGEGTSLDSLTARGRASVDTGSFGGGLLDRITLRGRVSGGEARISLEGRLGGGSLEGNGTLDLTALPGVSGSASLGLSSARVRTVPVDSMAAELAARNGAVDVEAAAVLADSGRVRMQGRWERGEFGQRVRVDSLRFAFLDLRAFLPQADSSGVPHTWLNGDVSGLASMDGSGWVARATVRMDSSRVGAEILRGGTVETRRDSSGTRVDLALTLADGEVDGEVRLEPSQDVPRLSIPGLRFSGLDVGGLVGNTALTTDLNGQLEGESRGTDVGNLTGRARLVLDSSTVAGVGIGPGRLEVGAQAGSMNLRLGARVAKGNLDFQGEGDLTGETPTYQGQGTLSQSGLNLTGGRASPRGNVYTRFGLEGSGTGADSLQARFWVEVDSASWDSVTVDDGRVRVAVADGVVRLDTLVFESELGSVAGTGRLPLSASSGSRGTLQIGGELRRADMLAPLLSAEVVAVGEAAFQASAAGALDDLDLEMEAHVNALLVDDLRAQGVAASGKLHRKAGEGFDQGSGNLTIDRLNMPSLPVRRLEADASLEAGNELAVRASAVLDDSRKARLSARVEEMPAASAVRVEEFEFTADEDEWTLENPTRISLSDGLEIDSLVLQAGDQAIRARGRVARNGPLDMEVEVTGFRIGTLSDLLGYAALQGQVSGSLSLSGDASNPRAEMSAHSSLEAGNAPPSNLDLTATYAEDSMNVDVSATMEGGAGFRARGTLPMDLSLDGSHRGLVDGKPLDVAFSADSLPLAWVGLFLPERTFHGLGGVLDGSVDLTGQPDDPVLDGALNVTRLNVGLPRLGVRYDRGRMALRLDGDRMILDSLRLRTKDGDLTGSGEVRIAQLDRPEYDLSVVADGFRAIRSSGVDITTSGRLRVSGTGFKPVVEGRLEVLRGDVYLGDLAPASEVERVTLTEEDYRELARVFGYRSGSRSGPGPNLFDSTTIDVDVALRRDSWIRQRANPKLAVQFSGDLSVQKAPGDSIRLVGEVSGIPERSYVEQFGRRFSLTNATVTFQGTPSAAQVDLRAEYQVPSRDNPDQPEVVIALEVTGTPENLNLELSSNPPLEASDMVSYLAVGQPASRTLGGGEGSLSQTGGALALGRLSSAVETYAREQVGLDVVEITTDGLDGVTLLAGRYVSPDLYLGIRQPLSLQRSSTDATERPQEPQFEVELQAVRWLLLNLQAGGQGDTKVFVRSRISYD